MNHLVHAQAGPGTRLEVTTESAGWQYLDFLVQALEPGGGWSHATLGREIALVPLSGRARVVVAGQEFRLERESVFRGRSPLLYVPPGKEVLVEAETGFEFAVGGAPAEGRYPVRLFTPAEMKAELRGGGAARRQVNHVLAPPLPAERLILFEVYVPGGTWSGWPPHCHDGSHGSAYLEETYYYRIEPGAGFAIHRNYARDDGFDELFTVRDGDLVLVTRGFHPVAAGPGSRVYFLNFLAGELLNEERARPPVDDPDHAWIKDGWDTAQMPLPLDEPSA